MIDLIGSLRTFLTRLTAARAGYIDELAAANLPTDVNAVGIRADAATADTMADLATASLVAELKRVLLRLSPDAFTATIQGAARTELDTMLAQLATYLKAAGAAYSATVGGVARADIEASLTALAAYFKTASAAYSATVGGAARTDVEASLTALAAYFNAASAALSVVSQPGVAARTSLNAILTDLADILAGTTGITNFPAAVAAANSVSLAEVIRYIQEVCLGYEGATTLAAKLTAARAGYIDELAAANIPTDIDGLKTSRGRQLFTMDFWSLSQEEVAIPAVAATLTLPNVTVVNLPAGAVVTHAIALLKFRVVDNINAAANSLDGATVAATSQVIQVRTDAPGAWADAIGFVDTQFGLAASTREGGDVQIGATNISATVTANDTYNFQYLLAKAHLLGINLNDVQTGLRIWYSV